MFPDVVITHGWQNHPRWKTTGLNHDYHSWYSTETQKLIVKSERPKQGCGQMPVVAGNGEGKAGPGENEGSQNGDRHEEKRHPSFIILFIIKAPQSGMGRYTSVKKNAKN